MELSKAMVERARNNELALREVLLWWAWNDPNGLWQEGLDCLDGADPDDNPEGWDPSSEADQIVDRTLEYFAENEVKFAPDYKNLTIIKAETTSRGSLFFRPKTMEFFNSKTHKAFVCGVFVTSENTYDGRSREYNVRWVLPNQGRIETIAKFPTLAQAIIYCVSLE